MPATILIVDDSVTVRALVRGTLQADGHQVLEASDGHAALEMLEKTPLDLVITDVNMPELDGLALLRAIRSDPRHRYLPVLVLTTEGSDEMKARGRAAGATGWLVKPFHPERLRAVVRTVMRRPAA
ncbi:MAG: response regulator [Armatimonadota bacterium]|nr:response regulator [Armatimonadota bacterium]MDR7553907.1 response regulator [Armatimonadota bacterium]MDR7574105.1 response regulator [Armatimonadota bacterium]